MGKISLILLAAGGSTRFRLPVKKQWLRIGEQPLWEYVADRFAQSYEFETVVIAAAPEEAAHIASISDYTVVAGGSTREASLKNALAQVQSEFVLVSDVARACVPASLIARVIEQAGQADCVVPALKVVDTVTGPQGLVDRDGLRRIQTPQLSRTAVLKAALEKSAGFTDESTLIAAQGGSVSYVEGDERAAKLTFGHEMAWLECLKPASSQMLTGTGFDVHAFEEGRPMMLGGVAIPVNYGFKAHSDGDVALHALTDAILGAAGLGDIGGMFPDSDPAFKNADSSRLLERALARIYALGFEVRSADVTIMAQQPRLENHKAAMRRRVADLLGVRRERVNIKATTTEKLGFVGRSEGVAVLATATLGYFDWRCL